MAWPADSSQTFCRWLFLAWALAGPMLAAQGIDNLHQQAWSTEQGLPQDSVHDIFQDHTGFLWIATEGGLARFDGFGFRVFDRQHEPAFTSDDICCITEDAHNDLWVGTADGLLRLHNERFERFSEGQGLPSSTIRALLTDSDGSLLVLTAGGLVRWTQNRFLAIPQAPRAVESMARGSDGGVWLIANGRAMALKGDIVSPGLSAPLNNLKGAIGVPGGALWSFSDREVAEAGPGTARHWMIGGQLPGNRIQSLFVDRAGAAWVGTDGGLAVIASTATDPVQVDSLRGNSVLQTYEDREGNYWAGTESSGLHLLRSLAFRTLVPAASKAVTAIVQDSTGTAWLGTRRDGLLRVRRGRADEPVRPEALTSLLILSLAAGQEGGVWAGTPDGLNHVDAQGKVRQWTSADGMPDDYIQALAADGSGCVFAGTRRGLAHVCGSRVDVLTRADGLGGDLVGTLLLTRTGDLWIGTSGGLSRRSPDGRIDTYAAPESHPQGIVSAMTEDAAGQIWVATHNTGLSRITGSTARRVPSDVFNADILGMVADQQGQLWLRLQRGIERVAIADLDRCVEEQAACSPQVSRYGTADGLPSDEMTPIGSPGLGLLANGELWAGTRSGIGIADTAHLPRNTVAPGVAIESFVVDGIPVAPEGNPLKLPYGGQRFTIEYAGLSFVAPSQVRYRFKLDGFDSVWTEAGNRRSATYTNLPPRPYTFRVQAMNNDGVWNEVGATLSFRIVPPFYRRWWFIALVALLAAALAIGVYRVRLRGVRARYEAVLNERNRIAREIHDTLAQDFVGVTLQLDIVAQMLRMRKIDAAEEQVRQARKLVTEGLAEARRSIWELRANAAADSLPTRLGRVVERYQSERPVIRTKIGGAFRPLDPRIESEVLRVAQEALSNVQRHSQATSALLELHYDGDSLRLMIEDDGQGFVVDDALHARERYGLSGLQERASLLGGTLEIASEPGRGTRLILTTKIQQGKDAAP